MFVDWFKNVSAMFVYVYEIYATEISRKTGLLFDSIVIRNYQKIQLYFCVVY